MADVPEITHTRTDLSGGAPKLMVELDEDAVRLAGLDLATVASQLEATLEGAVGGSLIEGTEELPVRVRSAPTMSGPIRTAWRSYPCCRPRRAAWPPPAPIRASRSRP